MFCLQAKDIFPIGDIALVNTIKELTDAKTKEELSLLAGSHSSHSLPIFCGITI